MGHDRFTPSRPLRGGLAILAIGALAGLVALAAVLSAGDSPIDDRSDGNEGQPSPQADAEAPDEANGEPAGEPAPDLSLVDFDGEPVRLADYTGQPLVVNFFASWCPPCVAEMRDALGPVHEELGDEVAFLGVAMQDTPEAALEVVEETGVTYDLARDPDGQLFAAFTLGGMPSTVYVDADGQVVDRHTGSLTRSQLESQIEENLSP